MYFNDMLENLTGRESNGEIEEEIKNLEDDKTYNMGVFSGLKYKKLKLIQEYIEDKLNNLANEEKDDFNRGQISAYIDIKDNIDEAVHSIDEWLESLNQNRIHQE